MTFRLVSGCRITPSRFQQASPHLIHRSHSALRPKQSSARISALTVNAMAQKVAVTGATGYVATELVKQLLERGYNVTGTVRDLKNCAKIDPLRRLGVALPGQLELVEADLLTEGAFDEAIKGSEYVFHVASPFFIECDDPQKQLVDPAVKGTRNVMSSVAKNKDTCKRVVVTSSVAAVKGGGSAPPRTTLLSEKDWNETSTIENGEAYWVSKTQAERAAWEVAEAHGLDLVTICPEFIMGPLISSRTDGSSVGWFKNWLEGKAQQGAPVFSDVRDIALAHIMAAVTPSASGRIIVANSHDTPPNLISNWLQERYPQFSFEDGEALEQKEKIDTSKATQVLGLQITPIQRTLLDMAQTMIQLGIASPQSKP